MAINNSLFRPDKQTKAAMKRGNKLDKKTNKGYSKVHNCIRCKEDFTAFATWMKHCKTCYYRLNPGKAIARNKDLGIYKPRAYKKKTDT